MKKWKIGDRQETSFERELGISPVLATILYRRGKREIESARNFLVPDISHLHSPSLFPDMEKAVNRIKDAIRKREKIVIWGDEDVDGMTATVLLFKVIEDIGGNVSYWIPRRATDGIGLSKERLNKAVQNRETLIITVDCGSSDEKMVIYAIEKDIDIIVTDHHEIRHSPNSLAFLNPKGGYYPFKQLAGVGVALKLALALVEDVVGIETQEFFRIRKDLLPLILLGTLSDRVPLVEENRIFVKTALETFPNTNLPFVQAIREVIGVTEPVVEEIVERVIPVLSAGREIKDENPVIGFFLSNSVALAKEILGNLLNTQQVFEEEFEIVYRECVHRIGDRGIIVLDDVPSQFLRRCASRLVKETGRPTILIGQGPGDIYIGEGRAPYDFDLVEFFARNEELFIGFGGHKPAAGFSIKGEKIEEFKKMAYKVIYRKADETNLLEVDVVVERDEFSRNLLKELMLLSPYGEGNPKPILATMNVQLVRGNRGYMLMDIPISGSYTIPVDREIDIAYSIDNRGILRVEDWWVRE